MEASLAQHHRARLQKYVRIVRLFFARCHAAVCANAGTKIIWCGRFPRPLDNQTCLACSRISGTLAAGLLLLMMAKKPPKSLFNVCVLFCSLHCTYCLFGFELCMFSVPGNIS